MSEKRKPDLRNAEDAFRAQVEDMKKRGIDLQDPKIRKAFLEAAREVAAEQRAELTKN